MPRSSIKSLKIRMMSHPCNKYEQIMLSYLLSVNYLNKNCRQATGNLISTNILSVNVFSVFPVRLKQEVLIPTFSFNIKTLTK